MTQTLLCEHCEQQPAAHRCGLCEQCYASPGIRKLYVKRRPLPGLEERIAYYKQLASKKKNLFHSRRYHGFDD